MSESMTNGSDRAFENLRSKEEEVGESIRGMVERLREEGSDAEIIHETPEQVTIRFTDAAGEVRELGFMKIGVSVETMERSIRNPGPKPTMRGSKE
jgi:hypothetical protein